MKGIPDHELLADVLARTHASGVSVSLTQLERWRKIGLIGRPTRVGLGRGEGTESRYPIGTTDQVIRIAHWLKGKRTLRVFGWVAWLEGSDLNSFIVRDTARTLEELETWGTEYLSALESDESASDAMVTRILRRFRLRRFVATAERLVVEVAMGQFMGDWLDPKDDTPFLRAFLRSRDSRRHFKAAVKKEPLDEGLCEFVTELSDLSTRFGLPALRGTLAMLTPELISQARVDLLRIIETMEAHSDLGVPIESVAGFGPLFLLARSTDPDVTQQILGDLWWIDQLSLILRVRT